MPQARTAHVVLGSVYAPSGPLDSYMSYMELRNVFNAYESLFKFVGPLLLVGIGLMGIRMWSYWQSFLFFWGRYRQRDVVTTEQLRAFHKPPFVKIQITTRGSPGSSEVILRGIRNVMYLADEDPEFYEKFLSVEVVTESQEQASLIEGTFSSASVTVSGLVLPKEYSTPNRTMLKARGLHYAVERRRLGWNVKPGKTFIVHYYEESVMVPDELRKLIAVLATTEKRIMEGPIYYPLEYVEASQICRGMEANRPVGCFECRRVMEKGTPLHLHGSNLVVEEEFENDLGWDIGVLDGQALIAEDYVFGMNAFLLGGGEAFGWHGCVMLEQPPFSVKSAFKQRHRWITGVLQGMAKARTMPEFTRLPRRVRWSLVWGTRFRITTFALGSLIGVPSLIFFPVLLLRAYQGLEIAAPPPLNSALMVGLTAVGAMWLGSIMIGAWYNVSDAGLSWSRRWAEIFAAVAVAPVAGIIESAAGLQAVVQWNTGSRSVNWQPTPKTKAADAAIDWRADRVNNTRLHVVEVQEAHMPTSQAQSVKDVVRLVLVATGAFAVVFLYIGVPMALLVGDWLDSLWHSLLFAATVLATGIGSILTVLHSTNLHHFHREEPPEGVQSLDIAIALLVFDFPLVLIGAARHSVSLILLSVSVLAFSTVFRFGFTSRAPTLPSASEHPPTQHEMLTPVRAAKMKKDVTL